MNRPEILSAIERVEAEPKKRGCGECGGIEEHEAHCPYRLSFNERHPVVVILLCVIIVGLLGLLMFGC